MLVQFQQPLKWSLRTIEYGFAQSHERSAESDEDCDTSLTPIYSSGGAQLPDGILRWSAASLDVLLLTILVNDVKVGKVHSSLDDVERSLSGGEAIVRIPRLGAVDVVNLAVELVWCIQRPDPLSSRHSIGTAKDVARVPDDQRQ